MTKGELLNGLDNILSNCLYGLVCQHLTTVDAWERAARGTAVFPGLGADIQIQLAPLARRLLDPVQSERLIRQFENGLLRAILRESHELILLYCRETNQFQLYKAEPWFQFARVLRNVVSHGDGGILDRWPNDLRQRGITNASWRDRMLDVRMVGTAVNFTIQEGLRLLRDQVEFVGRALR